MNRHPSFHRLRRMRRPADRGRIGRSPPARLGHHEGSTVVYAPDGSVTGVRHAWTFDDMFSTFATQGLESKTKGVFTREELQPLAEVNVSSLKEYELLQLRQGERQEDGSSPIRWITIWSSRNRCSTLYFTLPLKTPVKAQNLDSGSVRSGLFRRLQLRREGAGRAGRCAGRLQADRRQAAGNGRKDSDRAAARSRIAPNEQTRTIGSARSSPTRFR